MFFFLVCYTARAPITFMSLFYRIYYYIKVVRKVSNIDQTIYYTPRCLWKNTEHLWNAMDTFMIGSLVFSVCIKVCKNLQIIVTTDFWPNELLLENANFLSLKGRTDFLWRILMQAHHEWDMDIRMVNY